MLLKKLMLAICFYLIRARLNSVLWKTIKATKRNNIPIEKKREIFVNTFNKVIRKEVEKMIPPNIEFGMKQRFDDLFDAALKKALRKID